MSADERCPFLPPDRKIVIGRRPIPEDEPTLPGGIPEQVWFEAWWRRMVRFESGVETI